MGCKTVATVLLLEDEPNISMFVETVLTDEGHIVTSINNGISGLDTLSGSIKPDIVLLDLNLPGLSGRDIAKHMRSTARLKDIPIIIMSGCAEFSSDFPPKECYDGVLTKPFDITELIELVNRLTCNSSNKKVTSV